MEDGSFDGFFKGKELVLKHKIRGIKMFKIHEIENSLTGRDFTNIVAVKERIFVDPEINQIKTS